MRELDLIDNPAANFPERRTAHVGRGLAQYNVHISAISETRFAKKGQLKLIGTGYTLYWSGQIQNDRLETGVGFAFRNDTAGKLASLLKSTSNHYQRICPYMTNPEEIKNKSYQLKISTP
jgi:hypothetical protein